MQHHHPPNQHHHNNQSKGRFSRPGGHHPGGYSNYAHPDGVPRHHNHSHMHQQGGSYPRQDGHYQHHARGHQSQHNSHHLGCRPGMGLGPGGHRSNFGPSNASNLLGVHFNGHGQGSVMMVYGLHPDSFNCDRLFNLFCLYGNVIRIKFLRTKDGCAMVQMGDEQAAERCVSALNRVTLFGNDLQLSYSKQTFVHEVQQPYELPDGSPSFKDYLINKNNRFNNPEVASKNRILPPSQVLHFFNAPHGITEDELVQLFRQNSGYEPISVRIFTPKVENSKSFSGLAVFRDPTEASETLAICNHIGVLKPGVPHPFILRLCFSPPNSAKVSNHTTQSVNQEQPQQVSSS